MEDGVLLNTPALAHVFWSMLPEDSRGPTQFIYHLLCATHNKPYHAAHCHRGCLRGELLLVNIALKLKSWNKFSLSKISEIWVDFSSQVWMNLKMNKYLQNAKYVLVQLVSYMVYSVWHHGSWFMLALTWLNWAGSTSPRHMFHVWVLCNGQLPVVTLLNSFWCHVHLHRNVGAGLV